jgi:hypothetical protein
VCIMGPLDAIDRLMLAFCLELRAPLQFDQSMLHLCRFYKGNKKANNRDPQKPIFR